MAVRAAVRGASRRLGAPLPPSFYDRETELVARELLGAVIRCDTAAGVASGRIVETEAYLGEHDPGCHAAAGFTPRTSTLYGPPGTAYVYLSYGVHWCANAVTRREGLPSAVLIRAIEPLDGLPLMRRRRRPIDAERLLTNGPGKLCAALGVSVAHNALPLYDSVFTIHRAPAVADSDVAITARIGLTKAADWPLRWIVAGSPYLSRPHRPSPRSRISR